MTSDLVLGITGASGAVYAVRLLQVLLEAGRSVHLAISPAGKTVLQQELNLSVDLHEFKLEQLLPDAVAWTTSRDYQQLRDSLGTPKPTHEEPGRPKRPRGEVHYHHHLDLMAPMASGSALSAGMVICPCSGGTLGAIAHGASGNLIQRAADVHLKERRKLILVPRETPLSIIQLDNMRRCVEAGATVMPASPGWYHGVHALHDLVDFIVARICDQLGVEHDLMRRWGEEKGVTGG